MSCNLVSEMIELLQHNVTQTDIALESCKYLQKAAHSLQAAAEKQTQSCQTNMQLLQKKL